MKVVISAGGRQSTISDSGELQLAERLIDAAVAAGCDAVKFQKRTVDKVYTREYLDSPRKSPWGILSGRRRKGWSSAEKNTMRLTDIAEKRG